MLKLPPAQLEWVKGLVRLCGNNYCRWPMAKHSFKTLYNIVRWGFSSESVPFHIHMWMALIEPGTQLSLDELLLLQSGSLTKTTSPASPQRWEQNWRPTICLPITLRVVNIPVEAEKSRNGQTKSCNSHG